MSDSMTDRGEPITWMEPLVLGAESRHRGPLIDRVVELSQRSAGFRRSLPPSLVESLANLVRAMNCYYSNLIEGHDTHPIEIERALHDDYSQDPRKRDLQLEARAHVAVQAWLDGGALPAARVVEVDALREIHRRFGEQMPDELLWVEDPASKQRLRMVPGGLRERDVQVATHVPVSPGAVPRFLGRFAEAYVRLGKSESILCAAAAHHRLLWIHPFLDGNGRVARLASHAALLDLLDTGSIWSIARGLARNVGKYKQLLTACDQPRRGDLDGRGHLSEEALAEFTRFFLDVCIDQVTFMERLVEPERLRARILLWAEEEIRLGALPPRSGSILEAVLYRGELPRGEAAHAAGTGDRQARRIVAALMARGVLISEGPRAALRLGFPATLAGRWLPGLFPETVSP